MGYKVKSEQKTWEYVPNANFIHITSGDEHSLALSPDNHVWSSGWNTHGELGINSKATSHAFIKLEFFSKIKVTHINCGRYHSAAIGGKAVNRTKKCRGFEFVYVGRQ